MVQPTLTAGLKRCHKLLTAVFTPFTTMRDYAFTGRLSKNELYFSESVWSICTNCYEDPSIHGLRVEVLR